MVGRVVEKAAMAINNDWKIGIIVDCKRFCRVLDTSMEIIKRSSRIDHGQLPFSRHRLQ